MSIDFKDSLLQLLLFAKFFLVEPLLSAICCLLSTHVADNRSTKFSCFLRHQCVLVLSVRGGLLSNQG